MSLAHRLRELSQSACELLCYHTNDRTMTQSGFLMVYHGSILMKHLPLLLAALILTPAAATQETQEKTSPPAVATAGAGLSALLRDALFEEEATRDLTKAAAGYEALLAQWSQQRALAAAALYRLAEVRRKQDRNEDATTLYQRLLREFPDIEPHAKLARENLTALGAKDPAPVPAATDPPLTDEEATALQRVKKLATQSPDLLIGKEFTEACTKGWPTVVQFLISQKVADDGSGFTSAAENGHLTIVRELLALKPMPDAMGRAVEAAAKMNRIAVLKLLLESGADPNGSANTREPLTLAIFNQSAAALDLLLEHKANANPTYASITPLYAAARMGSAATVERLLALKANPNFGGHNLVSLNRPYSVELRKGILSDGKKGDRPLHAAIESDSIDCIRLLLAAGADPNLPNEGSETPLLHAVFRRNRDIATALLKAKANPNAWIQNRPGTAFAFVRGIEGETQRDQWYELFLEHGADPFAGNPTTAELAETPWRIRFLRSHKYPALAAIPAINLVFSDELRISLLAERKAESEKPGTLPALLTGWNETGGWQFPSGFTPIWPPDWSTLRLWRKSADGKMQETVLEVTKETQWPDLQWGDVIEVLAITEVPENAADPFYATGDTRKLPGPTLEILKAAK
jgi:ankyrin repeat protein